MKTPRHALLLLAAGHSRRLGRPKQLVEVEGEPLVRRAARLGLATGPADASIVLGAESAAVAAAVAGLPLRTVPCPAGADGLGLSLRAGLAAIPAGCEGALVLLCDQPALTAAHLRALVAAWRASPGRAAASAYAGVLGVPALLPRAWFDELAGLEGDRGARDLLRRRASEVTAVASPGLADDVDQPTDLAALGSAKRQE